MGVGKDISLPTRRAAGRAAAWPLLLCILAAAAVPARAAGIIYNNFGDDDASVADGAWAISQGYPIHAQPFMVALQTAIEPKLEQALGHLPVRLYGWRNGEIVPRGFEVIEG